MAAFRYTSMPTPAPLRKALKTSPPTELMLTLLNRVKDRRAVPLLLTHLQNPQNRVTLIQTLGLIGDLETGRGAPNIDTEATGTSLRDFRGTDGTQLPDELIDRYDSGSSAGELVFQP